MKQNTWLLILIGVLVACLCLSCVGGGGALAYLLSQSDAGTVNPTAEPGFPAPVGPRPTAVPYSPLTLPPRALVEISAGHRPFKKKQTHRTKRR